MLQLLLQNIPCTVTSVASEKGRAIPVQAWIGPEGSRRLRIPDFKTNGTWSWWGCQPYATAASTCQSIILLLTRVGPKVSSLTNKSHAKWKMLRGIYSTIYGEVNVSVSVCVEMKGDCIEK